jgi:hypothetical protein
VNRILKPQNLKNNFPGKMDRTLLLQSSDNNQNQYKQNKNLIIN